MASKQELMVVQLERTRLQELRRAFQMFAEQPESVLNPKQNSKDETERRGLRGQFLKQGERPRAARPVAPGTHVAGAT